MTLIQQLVAQTTGPALNPDATGLPGSAVLQSLINGIGWWALGAALLGIVIGAVAWGLGQHSQNYHQAYAGRKGVLVSAAAALLIGGASPVINFFSALGGKIK